MAKTKSALIATLVLGTVLRLVNLNQSLWLDEASQALQSLRPLGEIWFQRVGDFHPPLFYFLAHYWLIFNRSEIWLRLLPLTFGVANIYVLYRLSQSLFPIQILHIGRFRLSAPIASALILAIAPFHIYYSQEFRSYSLMCLLGTVSMYHLQKKQYLRLTLTNSLLLYTHYSSFFFLLAQLVYSLRQNRIFLKSWIVSFFGSCLLFLPWLPQFFKQLQAGVNLESYLPGWSQVLSLSPIKAIPITLFKLIAGRINFISVFIYAIYAAGVLAVTCLACLLVKYHRRLILSWLWVPLIAMLLVSFWLPQSQPFRVIFILPALVLLYTQAAFRFPRLFLTLIIYISLVGNVAYYTRPRLQREQWRSASEFLLSQNSPVLVKFSESFAPLKWYAPQLSIISSIQKFPGSFGQILPNLTLSTQTSPRLFVLDYLSGITDPDHQVEASLTYLNYRPVQTYNFEGVGFVSEYQKAVE